MYNIVYCDEFGTHLNLRYLDKWIDEINERLTAVEENVKPEVIFDVEKMKVLGDEIGIISGSYVDEKLYNKLEAKHEADCRLISEYDLENKKLENEIADLNKQIDSFGLTCRLYEKETKDLKSDVERWVDRYNRLRDTDKKRLFDLKNAENERDHYKGLYSSKCDDYDRLLEKQIKTEKELENEIRVRNRYKTLYDESLKAETKSDHYKELFHSLNHKHQKVVGEMKCWKDKYECLNDDYIGLEIEYNKLLKENKTFNVLLINKTETIGKLGAEYDKLKEQNDKLIKENKLLSESNNNHATDNIELEGKLEEKTLRIASLESKLRNQRTNLTSLQEKYEDATEQKDHYKNLFHSLNHNYLNVVGEMKNWKEKYESINVDYISLEKDYDTVLSTKNSLEFKNAELESKLEKPEKLRQALERENKALRETLESVSKDRDKLNSECYLAQENLKITKEKLKETEEKFNDACVLNKMREDVFEANIKLQKTIEAKDREIGLLRAELDKYKTDDECDDSWID